MSKMSVSNINHPAYSEREALQVLLETIDSALTAQNKQFEANHWNYTPVTISIAGTSVQFLLGGPQAQALNIFAESIASENGYNIDFKTCTVTE
jgi:hypothetical protein